jgi:hypothetical protein
MMQEAPDGSPGEYIHIPAICLPPFWRERPELWFAYAEARFNFAAITSEKTKFNYIISQLDYRHAVEVEDIIVSPPADKPYTTLKTELVRRVSSSRDQLVHQLVIHEETGDRKPSQFLHHLKILAPDVPDDFLRSIWFSKLPPHIQTILAGQAKGSLDAAVAQAPDTTSLLQKIEDLSRQVAALTSSRTRHRSLSRDRRKVNDTSCPAHNSADRDYCWYHRQFGDEARRCTPPCSFRQQGNGGDRR